jgi:leader peptidase (prepilin peptidase)/N-methyltransferase
MLGGKCRTCKKPIDWSYPLVEAITGILFLWWASLGFAFFQLSSFPFAYIQPIFWLIIGIVLVVIFFMDLLYGLIPDLAVVIMGIATFLYRVLLVSHHEMQSKDLALAIVTAVISMLMFWLLHKMTKGRGMGFGDVKFVLVMGLLLGFPKMLVALFCAFVLGGMAASFLLLRGKKKIGQTVPFGPFLIMGLLIALVWGESIWLWYWEMLK